ncbi:MAG TPA: radical SAM protein [Sumerlaeia bacterium]|nr:radical SAM protein [Sumerlaeia bacterium]
MSHVLLLTLYDQGAMGLRQLSSVLKADGHQVSVVYLKKYRIVLKSSVQTPPDEMLHEGVDLLGRDTVMSISAPVSETERRLLANLIRELAPDLIAFSLRSVTLAVAAALTRDVKARCQTPVVWGGIGPTLEPDRCLQACDLVCRGEGEGAIVDLARALDGGASWEAIPNLWGKRGGGRPAFRNPPRPLIRDLDALPYLDTSPEGKYTIENDAVIRKDPAISNFELLYETSSTRGCPFACTYCCNEALRHLYEGQPPVRRRSVDHVVGELVAARGAHAIDRVNFQDDVFSMDRKWLAEFCERYKREVGLPFWCYVHPQGLHAETLTMLRDAGMHWATLGIQSGSRRVLEQVYGRNSQREAIIGTARQLIGLGVDVNVDIMTNNPLETDRDCRDTLQLLVDLPRGARLNGGLSKLSVFPATRIIEILNDTPRPTGPLAANRDAYNVLYLLSRQSRAPGQLLVTMSRWRWLMTRPALLRTLLWPVRLRAALAHVRRSFPLWLKRRLPPPLWNAMRSVKNRLVGSRKPTG